MARKLCEVMLTLSGFKGLYPPKYQILTQNSL